MEDKKKLLMDEARKKHEIIFPCGKKTWDECFTIQDSRLLFWFNNKDNTTLVTSVDLKED